MILVSFLMHYLMKPSRTASMIFFNVPFLLYSDLFSSNISIRIVKNELGGQHSAYRQSAGGSTNWKG